MRDLQDEGIVAGLLRTAERKRIIIFYDSPRVYRNIEVSFPRHCGSLYGGQDQEQRLEVLTDWNGRENGILFAQIQQGAIGYKLDADVLYFALQSVMTLAVMDQARARVSHPSGDRHMTYSMPVIIWPQNR